MFNVLLMVCLMLRNTRRVEEEHPDRAVLLRRMPDNLIRSSMLHNPQRFHISATAGRRMADAPAQWPPHWRRNKTSPSSDMRAGF